MSRPTPVPCCATVVKPRPLAALRRYHNRPRSSGSLLHCLPIRHPLLHPQARQSQRTADVPPARQLRSRSLAPDRDSSPSVSLPVAHETSPASNGDFARSTALPSTTFTEQSACKHSGRKKGRTKETSAQRPSRRAHARSPPVKETSTWRPVPAYNPQTSLVANLSPWT
jgi:hypothetical protein